MPIQFNVSLFHVTKQKILLRAWPSVVLLVDHFKKRIAYIGNTTLFILTYESQQRMVQYLEPRLGVRCNFITSGTYVFVSF